MTHRRLSRLALALVLLGALLAPVSAPLLASAQAVVCQGIVRPLIAYDTDTITVADSAIGLTATMITAGPAVAVKVQVQTASIAYLETGTPTATEGYLKDVGDIFWVCGTSVSSFRAIRQTGASGKLRNVYYKLN